MELIPLLITLIILGVVAYIFMWAIGQIPMPQPIKVAVICVGALIIILVLLRMMPYPVFR